MDASKFITLATTSLLVNIPKQFEARLPAR